MDTSWPPVPNKRINTQTDPRLSSPTVHKPKLGRGFAKRDNNSLHQFRIIKDAKRWAYKNYDYTTMALFEKGGNPKNMNSGNTIAVDRLRVDVDSKHSLAEIISSLTTLGLNTNTDIVETDRGYHVIFYIKTFWTNGYQERVNRAGKVLDYLTRIFIMCGADIQATSVLGFYRIPRKDNTAYSSRTGEKLSLSDIETMFDIPVPKETPKREGLDRRGRFKQQSRLQMYFVAKAKEHPEHQFTVSVPDIHSDTGIPERTIEDFIRRCKEKGKLAIIGKPGKGRNRKTAYVWHFSQTYLEYQKFKPRHKDIYARGTLADGSLSRHLINAVSRSGLPAGMRNCGYFKTFLSFKLLGMGEIPNCFDYFYNSFVISKNGGDFSESEYRTLIKRVYKSKYRNFYKLKKMQDLLDYFGIGENVSHSPDCDCVSCVPDNADIDFDFGGVVRNGTSERVTLKGNSKLGLPELKLRAGEKEALDNELERIRRMNLEKGFC